ncbi:hypothetical protein [Lysobacter sp. D1-1-M9]|uniref:hypothetical protein n=1 Tax=Novilysobacter longmucuonensis TaxID=3098603 RepID=UPI002FC8CC1B
MDGRRFPIEAGMPSRKIPASPAREVFEVSGKGLSLVTFFGPSKKVTRLQAKAFDPCLSTACGYFWKSRRDQIKFSFKIKIKSFRLKAGHFLC